MLKSLGSGGSVILLKIRLEGKAGPMRGDGVRDGQIGNAERVWV